MNLSNRYFTKSLFKMGITCPTKLFYKNNPEYGSNETEDEYLTALAEGGILVEYVARKLFPDGQLIEATSARDSAQITKQHMEKEKVCLFEPTFIFNDILIRSDILIKEGNNIKLIEVKAKSFDPQEDSILVRRPKNPKKLAAAFKNYVLDIAFQVYIIKSCYPDCQIHPFLYFLDKTRSNQIDDLLNSFTLQYDNGKVKVKEKLSITFPRIQDSFFYPLDLNADNIMDSLLNGGVNFDSLIGSDFKGNYNVLLDHYRNKTKHTPQVGVQCKKCEYRNFDKSKSGFFECWSSTKSLTEQQCKEPFYFDLWQLTKSPKVINNLIEQEKSLLRDIRPADLTSERYAERQKIIVEKYQSNDIDELILPGLKEKLNSLKPPLHFIDFETSRLPVPTCKNMRPYQLIPFQFSIHSIDKTNKVTHKQYIDLSKGNYPIFAFIDQLIKYLSIDEGKIIHFSNFEVSILSEIGRYLKNTDSVKYANTIASIVKIIERCVDLQKIIVDYYYHPKMGNSNSIKKVLPAVLSTSDFLKNKYSQEIYGWNKEIHSLNIDSIAWIQHDKHGNVIDPYMHLPPILQGYTNEEVEDSAEAIEEVNKNNGGAAMLAYARAQYFDMAHKEKDELKDALLKYCELDSFAMVMIYEHLKNTTSY